MDKKDYSTQLAEMLQEIQGAENPFMAMMMTAVKLMMEMEINGRLHAEKSERSEGRTGYRSGYRKCDWDTLYGTMHPDVPKVRSGGYVPFFKTRRQRCDEALIRSHICVRFWIMAR